jgi:hypothetical protein
MTATVETVTSADGTPIVPGRTAAPGRPPLITRPLLVRFVSVIGAEVSFYLPLSVVPLYVKSSGSGAGAGLATGALLMAGVAAELATPRLVSPAPVTGCLWPLAWPCSGRPRWPCYGR